MAWHGTVIPTELAHRNSTEDHDQAESDDGASVEPSAQHPGAVFVDLKPFDVVVGEVGARGGHDGEEAGESLGFDLASEGVTCDHEGADVGDDEEDEADVAIDAVEIDIFGADGWDELIGTVQNGRLGG